MPTIPSADEYQGSNFGLLPSDEYRVRIESWEEHDNVSNKFNPTGEGKSIWFKLKPLGFADDEEAELLDDDGNPINPDKTLIFFYDPKRLGLVPVVAKSRKFLAAALGVPVEERIEFDGYDDLVGKEVVVGVITKNGKNSVTDVRPVRNRKRTRPVEKKPALAVAAAEIFGDDIKESSEDGY